METAVPPGLQHKLMTKWQAARAIGRSTRTVTRMLASGELKSFQHGKYTYITRASVEAHLKEIEAAIPS